MTEGDQAQTILEQIANGEGADSFLYDSDIYEADRELEGRTVEEIVEESQKITYESDYDYSSEIDDEDYIPTKRKQRRNSSISPPPSSSSSSAKRKTTREKFDVPLLSIEEQQEIEEPIEIDLRDVWKKYSINPIEHELAKRKKKNAKKLQDGDIVELSIGESRYKRASGKPEEAERLLYEVIRSHPLSAKLYGALGEMYDLAEDYSKALEFYLISAELGKKDSQCWEKSAEIASKLELYKSALNFYSRASKLEPKKGTYYLKRCTLLENSLKQYSESVKLLEKYLSILQADGTDENANIRMMLNIVFRIAKLLMNNLHKNKQALKNVEKFLQDFNIESNSEWKKIFTSQHVDLYFDVLLKNELYEKFVRKCFEYQYFRLPKSFSNLENCSTESLIEIIIKNLDFNDISNERRKLREAIQSKVIVCLIHLGHFDDIIQEKIKDLSEIEDPYNIQRVFPLLLESLIKYKKYSLAQKFSNKLIQVLTQETHYWYLHGQCLSHSDNIQDAMDAFEKAVKLDKNNYDAMHELSIHCNKYGDPQRALKNVSWQIDADFDDKQLYNRCRLLYSCKRWDDFVEAAKSLLENEMVLFQDWSQVDQIVHMPMIPNIQGLSAKCRRVRRKITKKKPNPKMNVEQFFDLWKKTVFVMFYYTKRREEALKWAFSGLLSNHFNKIEVPTIVCILRFCIDAKFEPFTYEWCTYLLKMYPCSGKMWYAFSVVMNDIYGNFRHKRFSMRLWNSLSNTSPNSPGSVNVLLMNGIIALLNGRYKIALAIFLAIYRMRNSEQEFRYDSFFIALSYLHLLMQQQNTNRCSLFAQMIAFFDDYARSGLCQETYYNLGRAFHQLGFIQHAIGFYQCALNTPSKVFDKRFDLEPEIAFNLSQIYKSIGRQSRANQLLHKYCSI